MFPTRAIETGKIDYELPPLSVCNAQLLVEAG
jgi:hypothetical protein